MSLKNCLVTSKKFNKEEIAYYENKKAEYIGNGMSEQEASIKVLSEAIDDVSKSMESVYSQVGVNVKRVDDESLKVGQAILENSHNINPARAKAIVKAYTGMTELDLEKHLAVREANRNETIRVAKENAPKKPSGVTMSEFDRKLNESKDEFSETGKEILNRIASETNPEMKKVRMRSLLNTILNDTETASRVFGNSIVDFLNEKISYDKENNTWVPSSQQQGEKAIEAESVKGTGKEKVSPSGDVQTYAGKKIDRYSFVNSLHRNVAVQILEKAGRIDRVNEIHKAAEALLSAVKQGIINRQTYELSAIQINKLYENEFTEFRIPSVAPKKGKKANVVFPKLRKNVFAGIDSMRVNVGTERANSFLLPIKPITAAMWNGSLTVLKLALGAGLSFAEAINESINFIKTELGGLYNSSIDKNLRSMLMSSIPSFKFDTGVMTVEISRAVQREVEGKVKPGASAQTWTLYGTKNNEEFLKFSGEINQKNVKEQSIKSYISKALELSFYNNFGVNTLNNFLDNYSRLSPKDKKTILDGMRSVIAKSQDSQVKKIKKNIEDSQSKLSELKTKLKTESKKKAKTTAQEKTIARNKREIEKEISIVESDIKSFNDSIDVLNRISKSKDINEISSLAESINHRPTRLNVLKAIVFTNEIYENEKGKLSVREHDSKSLEKQADLIYETAKNSIMSNLRSVYYSMAEPMRNITKLWYDGANVIAQEFAKKYNVTVEQASAIIATQSPQKPWYDNLHIAQFAMQFLSSNEDTVFTEMHLEKFKLNARNYADQRALIPSVEKMVGMKKSEMDQKQLSYFIRQEFELYYNRRPHKRIPTGQIVAEEKGMSSYNSYSGIEKAVSIYFDGSEKNISDNIGDANKVRNFYVNISNPNDERAVTIDTHAIAIALMSPMSANSPEVDFGPAGYAFYADAYRGLAQELGIRARELQSITWEAARSIFPKDEKNDAYRDEVNEIWKRSDIGEISHVESQNLILQKGMDSNMTEWSNYLDAMLDPNKRTKVLEDIQKRQLPFVNLNEGSEDAQIEGLDGEIITGTPGQFGFDFGSNMNTENTFTELSHGLDYYRNVNIYITPATVRDYGTPVLQKIKQLTDEFNQITQDFFNGTNNSTTEEVNRRLAEIDAQILDSVRQDIKAELEKIKGTKTVFDGSYLGLFDNKFEPSFKMHIGITKDADTLALSNLLFEFSEKYSQDAFIIAHTSDFDAQFKSGQIGMPYMEFDGDFIHYPAIQIEFPKDATEEKKRMFAAKTRENGISSFSQSKSDYNLHVMKFLSPAEQKLSIEEQIKIYERNFNEQINAIAKSWAEIFGGDVKYNVSIRKSRYIGADNEGDKQVQTRTYSKSRSDIFKEISIEVGGREQLAVELANLRNEEIGLNEKGLSLSQDKIDRMTELSRMTLPVLEDTFKTNEDLYNKAKEEVEKMAFDATASVVNEPIISKFPIKRASRASVKTMRWYSMNNKMLGDGARVNVLVDSIAEANEVFTNMVNTKSDEDKLDPNLRSVNQVTELGYPKRLVEVRTSGGVIAEMQVMTMEGYLAKDGVSYFPKSKVDTANKKLAKIREELGWEIPDGLGHYFYELHRDYNVPSSIRNEALKLSNAYYEAMMHPEQSTMPGFEFQARLTALRNTVNEANKSTWDNGNKGEMPKTGEEFIAKEVPVSKKDKLKKLANKLLETRIGKGNLYDATLGIPVFMLNVAKNMIARSILKGISIAESVEKAINWVNTKIQEGTLLKEQGQYNQVHELRRYFTSVATIASLNIEKSVMEEVMDEMSIATVRNYEPDDVADAAMKIIKEKSKTFKGTDDELRQMLLAIAVGESTRNMLDAAQIYGLRTSGKTRISDKLKDKIDSINYRKNEYDVNRKFIINSVINHFKENGVDLKKIYVRQLLKQLVGLSKFGNKYERLTEILDKVDAIIDRQKNINEVSAVRALIKKIRGLKKKGHLQVSNVKYINSLNFVSPQRVLRILGPSGLAQQKKLIEGIYDAYKVLQSDRVANSEVNLEMLEFFNNQVMEEEMAQLRARVRKLIDKGDLPEGTTVDEYLESKKASDKKEEEEETEQVLTDRDFLITNIQLSQQAIREYINEVAQTGTQAYEGFLDLVNDLLSINILSEHPAPMSVDDKIKDALLSDFSTSDLKALNNILNNIYYDENYEGAAKIAIKYKDFKEKVKTLNDAKIPVRPLNKSMIEKFGFNNVISRLFFNSKNRVTFLNVFYEGFNNKMNLISKKINIIAKEISKHIEKNKLTRDNDFRLFVYSFLNQHIDDRDESFKLRLNKLIDDNVIYMYDRFATEANSNLKRDMQDKAIGVVDALYSLGLIKGYTITGQKIDVERFDEQDLSSDMLDKNELGEHPLTDAEKWLYDYALGKFRDNEDGVEKNARAVYGVDFVRWNNYFPMIPYQVDRKIEELTFEPSVFQSTRNFSKQPNERVKNRQAVSGENVYYQPSFIDVFLNGLTDSYFTSDASREYMSMATLYNSKFFTAFLKGKFNFDVYDGTGKKVLTADENDKIFKNTIGRMINDRLNDPFPYKRYKSKADRFFSWVEKTAVGTVLQNTPQLIKQYAPNYVYTMLELGGGNPASKGTFATMAATAIQMKAIANPEIRAAYETLLGNTNSSNRVTLGNQAFDKQTDEIMNDRSKLKDMADITTAVLQGTGKWALMMADEGANNLTILASYIHYLLKTGEIKSVKDFDIVKESESPNKEALAYAEIKSARVNNDSLRSNRAKMLKDTQGKWFGHIWMLKGFNLNAWFEFDNSLRVMTNRNSTVSDRKEAFNTMIGYFSSVLIFNFVKDFIITPAYDIMSKQLIQYFVESMAEGMLSGDDEEKVKKERQKRSARFWFNVTSDAFLGGVNTYIETSAKLAANQIWTMYQKSHKIEDRLPDELKNSIYDASKFDPYYVNQLVFPGLPGLILNIGQSIYDGIEIGSHAKGTPQDVSNAIDFAEVMKGMSYIVKSGDMLKMAQSLIKNLKLVAQETKSHKGVSSGFKRKLKNEGLDLRNSGLDLRGSGLDLK